MHLIYSRKSCTIAKQCFALKVSMDETKGSKLENMVMRDPLRQLEMTDDLNESARRLAFGPEE